MGDEDGSNVVARGLGTIRNAFSGGSDSAEQAEKEEANGAPEQTQDGESTGTDAEQANGSRTQKAEEYADIMAQCAAGDLTARMEAGGEDETMDRIAVEFNNMVTELEKATNHLKSYVDEVEDTGAGVERSADTVRRASEDVVDSMQNISGDVENQREQLGTIAGEIEEVAATFERLAAKYPDEEIEPEIARLEEQASALRETAETNESIQAETTITSAAVEEQSAELSDVSGRADDLQRYSKPLRAILDRFETESQHESNVSTESPTAGEQQGTSD